MVIMFNINNVWGRQVLWIIPATKAAEVCESSFQLRGSGSLANTSHYLYAY